MKDLFIITHIFRFEIILSREGQWIVEHHNIKMALDYYIK